MAEGKVKERLLRQFIPPVVVGVDGSDFTTSGGGWSVITATDSAGNPTYWAVFRDYFDLSGIVVEQETLFTVNPMFQEGCDWNYTTTNTDGALQVWDLLTQEYITDATFDGVVSGSGNWIPPGMMPLRARRRPLWECQDIPERRYYPGCWSRGHTLLTESNPVLELGSRVSHSRTEIVCDQGDSSFKRIDCRVQL